MLTRRSLLALFAVVALIACGEKKTSSETPYAARYAVAKPAYVRPTTTTNTPRAVETFTDPQFTAAQADAGAAVYKTVCARCHASAQWTGNVFAANWKDRRLSDFYDLVSATMPQDNPGGLSPQTYVDVTAYVLQLAGFASGNVALQGDSSTLRHARIAIKKKASDDTTVAPAVRSSTAGRS